MKYSIFDRRQVNVYSFIFFISQLMSIRFILNSSYIHFNPYIFFFIYLISSCLIFQYILKYNFFLKIFLNNITFIFLIFTSLILLFYQYPIQDNLKDLNLGSDQDDCFLMIYENFISQKLLYTKTYLGNPCSTGIAEFIFYFPIIFSKNFFSIVPILSLIIIFLVFKNIIGPKGAILIFYIQISNLLFIELSSAGSDFILIGTSYLTGIYLLNLSLKKNEKSWMMASFILLLFFYGSRSVFVFLLPINFLIFYFIYSIKIRNYFLLLFLMVFLSYFIPWYYMYPVEFPPLHLFSKALYFINYSIYISLFLFIFFLVFLFYLSNFSKKYINKKINFYYLNYVVLILPLLFISILGFISSDNIKTWEELNYTTIFVPSLYFLILSNLFKKVSK